MNKYLNKNPLKRELKGNVVLKKQYFKACVVIPVFAENDFIFKTLNSLVCALKTLKKKLQKQTLLLLVVNNPPSDLFFLNEDKAFQENQVLLKKLSLISFGENITISWIDASSKNCEIRKKYGVGEARKIGMDSALHYLNFEFNPLIYSLDADSLVETNYFSATESFFETNKTLTAAVLDFKHQKAENIKEEQAIRLYECFIKDYVKKLRTSQSPYAYHSIGSTIVCRAIDYIRAGGMRTKAAGEDFYFLQALCKSGKPPYPIKSFTETCVHPSSRISNRVPFGTGQKIAEYINDPLILQNKKIYYNPKIFEILNKIILDVENGTLEQSFTNYFNNLPFEAKHFLEICEFPRQWAKILKNTPKKSIYIKWAFHTWFDAFRILKFIHFCEESPYNYQKISL